MILVMALVPVLEMGIGDGMGTHGAGAYRRWFQYIDMIAHRLVDWPNINTHYQRWYRCYHNVVSSQNAAICFAR